MLIKQYFLLLEFKVKNCLNLFFSPDEIVNINPAEPPDAEQLLMDRTDVSNSASGFTDGHWISRDNTDYYKNNDSACPGNLLKLNREPPERIKGFFLNRARK